MKKFFVLFGALILAFAFTWQGTSYAQFGNKVADTPHNLRKATKNGMGLTDWGGICVYCHTPHNNNTAIEAPLWNRSAPAGPYTMYSSPSIDMTIASSPQGVSLACLSCHDNTIGLDQVINVPVASNDSPSGTTINSCSQNCHTRSNHVAGLNFEGTNIGTDLRNDHPISITYDPSVDPKFNPASNGKVGNLPLYGSNHDQVECATCHNPHDETNRPFLRVSNSNSALCLTCHNI
ncbi:MAG: cytochrome c3 family protein [Calditrichaeota bacterium]|nr:cytochrome c3 family protein [Calditrichota bacterium]